MNGDLREPRRELRAAGELVEVDEGPDVSLLHGVFGFVLENRLRGAEQTLLYRRTINSKSEASPSSSDAAAATPATIWAESALT
jgi:hypothetical protein